MRRQGGLGLYYRGEEVHIVGQTKDSPGTLCYGPSSRQLPGAVADLVRQFCAICANAHVTRERFEYQ